MVERLPRNVFENIDASFGKTKQIQRCNLAERTVSSFGLIIINRTVFSLYCVF